MTRRLRTALLVFGAFASLALGTSPVKAQTPVALLPIPHPQFFGQNGQPLAGCKIFTFITGTSTPLGTFFDSAGTIPNQNPVTCDAGGFVSIWLIIGDTYRIVVQDQFGTQQYIVDGVVGIGGGSLSLFSTPNTWTALQTFSGGASINGGTLNGTFSGSPSFSGTLQLTTFTISNSTVIANLNSQLWNGTSASAGGALTNGWVPVVSGASASTWGPITNSILPGSGITTVNGTPCTLGGSCAPVPSVPNCTASLGGYALTFTAGAFTCSEIIPPTFKKGSNSATYDTASTTFVDVDTTNLKFVVTIPTGSHLVISASGVVGIPSSGGAVATDIALADGGVQLVDSLTTQPTSGANVPFSLLYMITGDGASHSITLQFQKHSGSTGDAQIQNSSGVFPTMLFTLQ